MEATQEKMKSIEVVFMVKYKVIVQVPESGMDDYKSGLVDSIDELDCIQEAVFDIEIPEGKEGTTYVESSFDAVSIKAI